MKKFFFVILSFICSCTLYAQTVPGRNNSISITYAYSPQKYNEPTVYARINNSRDAINGVAYNYGNAMGFNISSPQNYTVRISARPLNAPQNPEQDLRNYIFYSVADNNTDGRNYGAALQPLGVEEKTLLSGCPATRTFQESPENHYRSFSLLFWAKIGYSVPPGNYTTQVILTATTE